MALRQVIIRLIKLRAGLFSLGLLLSLLSGGAWAEVKLDLHRVDDPSLRRTIEESSNFPDGGFVRPDRVDDGAVEARRVTQLMRALGYITAHTEILAEKDGRTILLPTPGDAYRLGFVALEGIPGDKARLMQEKLQFAAARYLGKAARSDVIARVRRDVLQVTREYGYPTPSIDWMTKSIHRETLLIGLTFSLNTGVGARFGEVIAHGDIDSKSLTAELAGLAYNPDAITRIESRIEARGLFRRVSLAVVPRAGDPATVDVVAELRKKNKTEADLAQQGRVGLGIFVACCLLLSVRQVVVAALPADASHRALDIIIALASAGAVYFALERILYLGS